MVSKQPSTSVTIRIICLNPPASTYEDKAVDFGLQDKSQNLVSGQLQPNGSLVFEFSIEALKIEGQDQPDWRGLYVHGTPNQRFLYLAYGYKDNDKYHWIRRIKIMLSAITWQHIEAASKSGSVLEAIIDGSRAATVKLLGDGWVIRAS
jgi:hypothetical protein